MFTGAIIGLGNVALNGHLPAWKKNQRFKITAGIDSLPDRRKTFSDLMPEAGCFSSLEEYGSLRPDFVDICTPPHTHFTIAKQALEKGYHVLCEKPLVISESDFQILGELAQKHSKVLMTVHNWKFAPICKKIAEIVHSGVLGELKHCAWYVLRNGPSITTDTNNWRLDPKKAGGGILVDHGWHAFYLLLEWMNANPQTVYASLENRQYENLPVEDTAKIKLQFNDNLTAEVFLTWASRVRRNWGIIEGSKAILQIEDDSLKVTDNLPTSGSASASYSFDPPLSQGSHHPEWFSGVIQEFETEINNPELRGRNLKTAKSCLKLIERAKESSQQGNMVTYR